MAALEYTRKDVLLICQRSGYTISNETAFGCVAKKDNSMFTFKYITEAEKQRRLEEKRKKMAATVAPKDTEKAIGVVKADAVVADTPVSSEVAGGEAVAATAAVSESAPKQRRKRRSKEEIEADKAAAAAKKKSSGGRKKASKK